MVGMPRPDAAQKIADAAPRNSNRALIAILVSVLAVAGVVLAVSFGVLNSRTASTTSTSRDPNAVPKGATGFGGGMVLNPGAPATAPTLEIFEDPQCPACKQFETVYGPTVETIVKSNQAKVVVHTMTFLDDMLRNDSSARAANAAMCAAEQGRFHEYVKASYAGQPAREGAGYSNADLETFAGQAIMPDLTTWRTCSTEKWFAAHVQAIETASEKAGVNGTPTVRINGKDLKLTGSTQELLDALKAAGA